MTATEAMDNPSYFALAGAEAGRASPEPPPPPAAPAAPAPPAKPLLPLLRRRPRGHVGPRTVSQGAAPSTTRRLGFRWLLRSVSGSSASLQQIAQGQPRPGDVAPPSPTADLLCSLDAPGPLASPGPVVSPGRLRDHHAAPRHSAAPAPAPAAPSHGYYNVEAQQRRRHSLGSVAAPRTRPVTSPEAAASTTRLPQSPDADDIVLVWSGGSGAGSGCGSGSGSAAALWISYLQSCFVEICRKRGRPSFRTADVGVDELESGGGERWRARLEQAKLVVLVVCPALLARVPVPAVAGALARLDPSRTLLMLLGVQERELQLLPPDAPARPLLACRRMAVRDQDASFVGEFLAEAMDILVRAWRSCAARERRAADGAGAGGARFSLAPKKVKLGGGKVLALLAAPLQPCDDARVAVHKGGDPVPVAVKTRNPYTLQFTVPDSLLDASAMVTVTVSVNGQSLGSRQLKCESRLRELDRILRAQDNPLQFLCQTFGFGPADLDALDSSLLCNYMRNVPPHFSLLHGQGGRPSYSCEMYPTLLHFAAHLGLERLAMALLEGPGGEQACYIRNSDDLTPADLSERAGHQRLACTLQGYMQMSELSSVYTILKTITESTAAEGAGEGSNYLSPRPVSETYSVPPPPAPVCAPLSPPPPAPAPGGATDPPPPAPPPPPPPQADPYVDMISLRTSTDTGATTLYQNMPAPGARAQSGSPPASPRPAPAARPRRHSAPEDALLAEGVEAPGSAPEGIPDYAQESIPEYAEDGVGAVYQDIDETDGSPPEAPEAMRRRGSDPALTGVAADEDEDILGIIHDLKSSSFSLGALGEVEHLVESWRGRNATHQSLRDKQEQLARMREELQRVERRLGGGGETSRPSPFERIKRVFHRARHGRSKARPAPAPAPAAPARPPSSLSRRSSSSSTWSERSTEPAEHPDLSQPPQVEEVSWLHPVSPASDEHYVVPHGVRPVAPLSPAPTPAAGALDLADDGFPLDSTGLCSYVNVQLPSWPPPVPARPQQPLLPSTPE